MYEMDNLFRQSDFSAENKGLEKRIWNRLTQNDEEVKIMPINKNELSKEMLAKAMQCETAEELIALAKSGGYEITKEEAEAYLAELDDVELDESALKKVAGGDGCPDRLYIGDCQQNCLIVNGKIN